MGAWRLGHPAGQIEPTDPRVQVVDTSRKEGQTLRSHEILGQTAEERHRTFVVRLHLETPEETREARFFVLGIDPMIVFLDEDYRLITHWDHRMPAEPEKDHAP